MKCISLTGRGTQCSRNAVINGKCTQHYHLDNATQSNVSSDETREFQFQRILKEFGPYLFMTLPQDMVSDMVSHFQDLTVDYYRQKFLNIVINHRHLFDDTVLEDINETENVSESDDILKISEAVKNGLLRWFWDRKKDGTIDTLNYIKYLTCMKEIVKLFIYRKIQTNSDYTGEAVSMYKGAEKHLTTKKKEWREENINKLVIKEVDKCNVMCCDVFKHVFMQYM